MKTGDEVIYNWGEVTYVLIVDDHVPYDPAAYQHDEGWWVYNKDNEDESFFLSSDGSLYNNTLDTPMFYDRYIGKVTLPKK